MRQPSGGTLSPTPHYSEIRGWAAEISRRRDGRLLPGPGARVPGHDRSRDTIPARVLADLADLDALETAVLAAKNAPPGSPADAVLLPEGQQMDGPLRRAVISALPDGHTFGFNTAAGEGT